MVRKEGHARIQEFREALGLAWDVRFEPGEVDTPTIVSDMDARAHLITMSHHPVYVDEVTDLLVRARLSEQIDRLFSQAVFDPSFAAGREEDVRRMQQIDLATKISEVWINDISIGIDRALVLEGLRSTLDLGEHADAQTMQSLWPLFVLDYAVGRATVGRHRDKIMVADQLDARYERYRSKLAELLPGGGAALADMLYDLAHGMEPLIRQTPQGLMQLERYTRETAHIFGLGVKPGLVHLEGGWVWSG